MNPRLFYLILFSFVSVTTAFAAPTFSNIVRIIESQPLENAELVYWDQSTADALGIQVPPGRIGQPAFNQAVLSRIGVEIKKDSLVIKSDAAHDASGSPYLFIEQDAHGGSGRAGYLEVQPGVFVNIKGIGITGAGRTSTLKLPGAAQPPSGTFRSHADGSATLEEAIKEAVSARVADAEFSHGASRVVAIIYTGRTILYPDGRHVPLAEIVRAPLRRFDQDEPSKSAAVDSLAEANAKRVIKGDFVNRSNIGSAGEWVDFGCMSFTCGYAPIVSSQGERSFYEGNRFLGKDDQLYTRRLGQNLIMQMGIPESYVQALGPDTSVKTSKALESLGTDFRSAVYWKMDGLPEKPVKLDFEQVDEEKLLGNIRFHEFFKEAAERYFTTSPGARDDLVASETERLLSFTQKSDPSLQEHLQKFVKELHQIFGEVERANKIEDPVVFGHQVKEIAYFTNRSLPELTRPQLFSSSGHVADQFNRDHDPLSIQRFIDSTVQRNRFGTAGTAESGLIIRETPATTDYYVRAFQTEDGTSKLFAYPELGGAPEGKDLHFRVSSDHGQSYRDYVGKFVKTHVGDYFQVSVPHGDLPLTWEQVQLTPFVRNDDGGPVWLADKLDILGPPLVTNERLGLPPAFTRKPGIMRSSFGTLMSLQPDDLVLDRNVIERRPLQQLVATLVNDSSDKAPPSLYQDISSELMKRKDEAVELYKNDMNFKKQADAGMARKSANSQQSQTRLILQWMFRGTVDFACIHDGLRTLLSKKVPQ
jgi:hypothetical protein